MKNRPESLIRWEERREGKTPGFIHPGLNVRLQAFQLLQVGKFVVGSIEKGLFQGFEDLLPFRRWIEGALFHIVLSFSFW